MFLVRSALFRRITLSCRNNEKYAKPFLVILADSSNVPNNFRKELRSIVSADKPGQPVYYLLTSLLSEMNFVLSCIIKSFFRL